MVCVCVRVCACIFLCQVFDIAAHLGNCSSDIRNCFRDNPVVLLTGNGVMVKSSISGVVLLLVFLNNVRIVSAFRVLVKNVFKSTE